MSYRSARRTMSFVAILLVGTIAGTYRPVRAFSPQDFLTPNLPFPVVLPSGPIKFGSVTLADITGDGRPDILVGGSDGVVSAISSNGRLLWQFHTDAALSALPGVRPSATTIRSAPTVADIDGDGKPEIIVSIGEVFQAHQNGGVVALHTDGTLVKGWPQLTMDRGGNGSALSLSDGFTDGVVSSPAVADLFNDGQKEIIYGAFDQMIYVKHADGSNVNGWPKFVRDTVWSSPAVADLNGDGRKEVIIGIDAHADPFYGDLNGGYVKVYEPDGTELPGWPQYEDDAVMSSPAVADLFNDGKMEVVVGSSGYYGRGHYVTAYRPNGSILWRAATPTSMGNSPAIGDINGDGKLDVVIVGDDRRLYAWDGQTGNPLAPYPITPTSIFGPEATGPVILGDYDGDGVNDIFVTVGGQVAVIRGKDGVQLTASTNPPGLKPVYSVGYTSNGTPALGDLNGDGKLDLVTAGPNGTSPQGLISAWTLPNSSGVAGWPMFHGEPNHTGQYLKRQLVVAPTAVAVTLTPRSQIRYNVAVSSNSDSPLPWSVTLNDPQRVVAYTISGNLLQLTLSAPETSGTYRASVSVQATGSPSITIPITLIVVNKLATVYVPIARR